MATMKDIAGLVGVSLTTVSNVVHGNYDRVSPQCPTCPRGRW